MSGTFEMFDREKELCDRCLALPEDAPVADRCETKVVDWSIRMLGDRAPDLLRLLEARREREEQ